MIPFTTSAPGRLCLFGEHQDYLGLPVIAMAINRRCRLDWTPRPDSVIRLTSESMGEVAELDLDQMGQGAGRPLGQWLDPHSPRHGSLTQGDGHPHPE